MIALAVLVVVVAALSALALVVLDVLVDDTPGRDEARPRCGDGPRRRT